MSCGETTWRSREMDGRTLESPTEPRPRPGHEFGRCPLCPQRGPPTGDSVEFVRVPAPSTEDISAIVDRVHRYAVRLLRRRGLFADDGEAPLAEPVVSPDDVVLGQCYGGALTGRAASGPTVGQPSGRLGRLLRSTPPQELGPRCANSRRWSGPDRTPTVWGD